MVEHNIDPVYDSNSRILILGSFPSVLSRKTAFYYGHPQNRFWKVISSLTEEKIPSTIEEKKSILLKHHIALWDVIKTCDISGSADSSIDNVSVNDINNLLKKTDIETIYCNGKKAYELYNRYLLDITKKEANLLPSTSPANAAWSMERLIKDWQNKLNI